jgi:hypothetical protein
MAQDNRTGDAGGGAGRSGDTGRFDNMSDQELRDFIGGDVDPSTSRADLIVLAIETDTDSGR